MKKDIFEQRNFTTTNIPKPKIGETLWEVTVEGRVFGTTLVWGKDIEDAKANVDYGNDFAFVRSEDEPDEWNTLEWDESVKLFPDNSFLVYDPMDQIVYIPLHAEGDIEHEDCEFGFVVLDKGEDAFCRYWNKDKTDLRTKANSELTPKDMLYPFNSVPGDQVRRVYEKYVIS